MHASSSLLAVALVLLKAAQIGVARAAQTSLPCRAMENDHHIGTPEAVDIALSSERPA